jgi:hypothetical protein
VPALPRPRSAAEAVRAAFRAPRDGREGDLDQGLQAMRLLQVRPARGWQRREACEALGRRNVR